MTKDATAGLKECAAFRCKSWALGLSPTVWIHSGHGDVEGLRKLLVP